MGDFFSFSGCRNFQRGTNYEIQLGTLSKVDIKKEDNSTLFQRIKVWNLLIKKKSKKNAPKMVFWSNLVGSCVVIGTCACHYGWVTENNPKPTLLFPLVTVWHSLRMPQQWGQIILKFKSEKFPGPKNFTRKSVDAAFFSFCSWYILKVLSFVALMFQKRYEIP